MANQFTGTERVYYPKCYVVLTLFYEDFDATSTVMDSLTVVPIDLNIERNSYSQADSFSITFDGKDLPIHPDRVRTGNVSVWLFDSRSNEYVDPKTLKPDDRSIAGIIDDIDYIDNEQGSTVTIHCQDFTALFTERRYRDSDDRRRSKGKGGERIYKNRVVNNQNLFAALEAMIAQVSGGSVKLENRTGVKISRLPRVGDGSTATTSKRGFPVKDDATYWDVMTQMVGRHGYIIYVENDKVILGRPLKVMEGVKIPTFNMLWGNNVTEVNISRKMAKERTPRIRVVSYDDKTKRVVSATYPVDKKQIATTGVGTKFDEIKIMRVNGVSDKNNLLRLAENAYNQISRGESMMTVKTCDMLDADGNNLVKVTTGNLMQVHVQPFHQDRLDAIDAFESRVTKLISRGGNPVNAAFLAQLEIQQRPLYVRKGSVSWSIDGGVELDFELIELIDLNKGEPANKPTSRRQRARKQKDET